MKKMKSLIEYSQSRIKKRLYLRICPDISLKIRKFKGPDGSGHYRIESNKWDVIEPSESLFHEGCFNRVKGQLEEEYPQLYRDTDRSISFQAYLIEPIVCIGSTAVKISGGFNCVIMGVLKSGEKYSAILDVMVCPMLRRCGLMSLMKHAEIELANREKCDFIQTFHASDNPDFNAAIVPSLKRGFILYHGEDTDGEDYEDKGFVHLRYYIDPEKRRNVAVGFKGGKELMSPEDNESIIHYLEGCPDMYSGKTIRKIEAYGKAMDQRGKTKVSESREEASDTRRIFIAEGMTGFAYARQRNTYRVGDTLSFCPQLKIDHCVNSRQTSPYLRHIIYNIYEFVFKPDALFYCKIPDGSSRKDYLVELFPGFTVYCSTWKEKPFLTVGRWYEGYGRLDIRGHHDTAGCKTPFHIKDIVRTGKLVGISENLMQKDFAIKHCHQVKKFRYGKDVFSDEDAIEWFGYYRDLEEFKMKVSSYLENPVEYESTDSPEPAGYSPQLIYCVEI